MVTVYKCLSEEYILKYGLNDSIELYKTIEASKITDQFVVINSRERFALRSALFNTFFEEKDAKAFIKSTLEKRLRILDADFQGTLKALKALSKLK